MKPASTAAESVASSSLAASSLEDNIIANGDREETHDIRNPDDGGRAANARRGREEPHAATSQEEGGRDRNVTGGRAGTCDIRGSVGGKLANGSADKRRGINSQQEKGGGDEKANGIRGETQYATVEKEGGGDENVYTDREGNRHSTIGYESGGDKNDAVSASNTAAQPIDERGDGRDSLNKSEGGKPSPASTGRERSIDTGGGGGVGGGAAGGACAAPQNDTGSE